MQPDTFDVVVVGGGPAGNAAAISLARSGLKTLLLHDEPRGPQPGETIHPGAETIFRELGVQAEVAQASRIRHFGNRVEWGAPIAYQGFGSGLGGPWRGYQIARYRLNAILRAKAQTHGAQVRSIRANSPRWNSSRVVGVDTRVGSIEAKYVVDASGSSHWLSRMMKMPLKSVSPTRIAWFGWATSIDAADYFIPLLVSYDSGWLWIAQVERTLCAWTRVETLRTDLRKVGLPAELRGFTDRTLPRGADVTWRFAESHAGAGYFVVGDAGTVFDPLSSHGILRALLTGLQAAARIVRIIKNREGEDQHYAEFTWWVLNWQARDQSRLEKFYASAGLGMDVSSDLPAAAEIAFR
jgi:flavin-dependent dehydrogenase